MIQDALFGVIHALFNGIIAVLPEMPAAPPAFANTNAIFNFVAYWVPMDTAFTAMGFYMSALGALMVWKLVKFVRGGG